MKYLKSFDESVKKSDYINFLLDFGMFITMNICKISDYSKDDISKSKLLDMLSNIRKPIINGMNYTDLLDNITKPNNNIIGNGKLTSAILSQIKSIIEYMEPIINLYVKDCENRKSWMLKIQDFKKRYKLIISN